MRDAADWKAIEKPFRVFLGQAWEELVRATLKEKPLPGSSVRWINVGRWWGTGLNRQPLEVDVVAESSDGKTLLVGEAKLKLSKLEAEHALAELNAKSKLLPFAERYEKIACRLFVAEKPRDGEVSLDWVEE